MPISTIGPTAATKVSSCSYPIAVAGICTSPRRAPVAREDRDVVRVLMGIDPGDHFDDPGAVLSVMDDFWATCCHDGCVPS